MTIECIEWREDADTAGTGISRDWRSYSQGDQSGIVGLSARSGAGVHARASPSEMNQGCGREKTIEVGVQNNGRRGVI